MSVKEVNKIKKFELLPPDGGYGFMIILSSVIILTGTTVYAVNFGMIFNDLFIELGMTSTGITLVNGANWLNVAIGGFFTSAMLKFLSIRQLGLISAFVYNFGLFCTVFVKSQITFLICFGIIQSLGHGVLFNLSQTNLKNYFFKRRLLAFSTMQTIVGVLSLFVPQLIKWILEQYGYRGTQLLITGFSMNIIFAAALMQPVSWHMIKVEIPEDKENETKSLMTDHNQENLTNDTIKEQVPNNNRMKSLISKVIDISEFKSFLLSNASVGVALTMFCDVTFMIMLPQALYSMNWNKSNVAWAMSLSATGDLTARVFFIIASKWLNKISSHEIFLVGLVIAFISRLGMLGSDNMTVMIAFITMMGISRCFIMLLLPVVIAEAVGEVKFTSAMGVFMLLFGFFNLLLGPAIGGIRDLTNSYPTAFYVITSGYGIVIMFWSIELIYRRNKHKRQLRKDLPKA